MKNFKDYLAESLNHSRITTQRSFKDSVEAAEFVDTVGNMVASVPMQTLAREVDAEHGTKVVAALKKAISAYVAFLDELDNAG